MSRRLDQQREAELQPKRMDFVRNEINKMGLEIIYESQTAIQFIHKGNKITIFPYSGWFSGKGIKQGRGWRYLKRQL